MKYEKGTFTTVVTSSMEGLSSEAQVIYFWLCSFANNETSKCFPGIGLLCEKTSLCDKTVRVKIKELQEKGRISYVKRQRPDGSYSSNEYTIYAVPSVSATGGTVGDTGGVGNLLQGGTVGDTGHITKLNELKEIEPNLGSDDPTPDGDSDKEFGNLQIKSLLESIKEITGLPVVAGGKSRQYAWNFIRALKKNYPDKDCISLARQVIGTACKLNDGWHSTKAHDPKHLFYNWQEIVAKGKSETTKPKLNPIGNLTPPDWDPKALGII